MPALNRYLAAALLAGALPAHAAVYTCVDAKGNKSISDKPCLPAQTTQKVYVPPARVTPPEPEASIEFALPSPEQSLIPQTPEELEAMLRARESAAQRQQWEAEEAEQRRRAEPRRQMESYLKQRQQQRDQWRAERSSGTQTEASSMPESLHAAECESLRRQKTRIAAAMRQGYSASSSDSLNESRRLVDAELYSRGCNF